MNNGQTNIFEMIYPTYKIKKPIRLIEFFAGYGSQALALKYLGVPFEHWKICEWAIKSIQAYKDIHFTDDNEDYSKDLTKEQLQEYLFNKGISSNYNEPMIKQQVDRLSENNLRVIYNNIKATHNLVNIQQVKGKDLEIVDTDKYDYILTYSFPCQDLSLAGKGKGMSDTSTRSGMLWEVERILTECKELGTLPQILLMENVPQVHGADNVEDFNKWQFRLEELGYKNYWQDLIATDYGIPQTRNRCFMISILGDYNYTFPKPIPLKLKLKDMLEDNVDEKYYLSDKTLQQISNWKSYQNPLDTVLGKESVSPTITTRIAESQDGGINVSMKVYCDELDNTTNLKCKNEIANTYDEYNHKINGNETIGTIQAMYPVPNHGHRLIIKNATKQGYLEATEGDGVDISARMEYHRGIGQKGKTQTLSTMGGENNGVVVNLKRGYSIELKEEKENVKGVDVLGNYSKSNFGQTQIVNKNGLIPTFTENHGQITAIVDKPKVLGDVGEKDSNNNTQWKQQNRIYDDKVAISVTTAFNPYYKNDLRIRKLTPKECFRLMGVKDEDYEKCARNQSDSSLYHLAGDSIVCQCLEAIFKQLL